MPEYFGKDIVPEEMPEAFDQGMTMQKVITEEDIAKATKILTEYKNGKEMLERRIIEDDKWYRLRHWEVIRRKQNDPQPRPTSAWLFNSILNKHADFMDNYPEAIVLPRERSDEESAKTLSAVLPVLMEYNGFHKTYSKNCWKKLQSGTAIYGAFWNPDKENGLGDIDIQKIDILKVFWEPGITDIQDSANLFIVELVDEESLNAKYPEYEGKLKGNSITVAEYAFADSTDTKKSEKQVVVDWYYKVDAGDGRTLLHYVKFCGDQILYASENDPELRNRGFYDHGKYPVVFDVMFPEEGTPCGFGVVAISKDPQMYIDALSANILENSLMGTKKRFLMSTSTGVNREQLMDWNNPIVDVEGSLDDARIREINVQPLAPIYQNVLQMKIEEMKETSANRDVNAGGAGAGISAAAAISALQSAGNKVSRDLISQSYTAYEDLVKLVLELMAQFYTEARTFRITGANAGEYEFADVSNIGLAPMPTGTNANGETLFRKPIFDLKIKAQKKNPFSQMEENERAKELYSMGFFNPERAQEALGALEMMSFEGIDKVRDQVSQGQTLLNMVQQMSQQMAQMAQLLQLSTGASMGGQMPAGGGSAPQGSPAPAKNGPDANAQDKVASGVMQAQKPMTDYGQRLAKRSAPDMSGNN